MDRHLYRIDQDYGSTTSSYLGGIMDVLPIITPKVFALKYQRPPEYPCWIRSGARKNGLVFYMSTRQAVPPPLDARDPMEARTLPLAKRGCGTEAIQRFEL